MLRRFKKTARLKATMLMVATYAFCVLAPNAALAFTRAAGALHCLTEPTNLSHTHTAQKPAAHQHTDGTAHVHNMSNVPFHENGNAGHGKVKEKNCCGLFCVTALNGDGVAVLPTPPPSDFAVVFSQPERAAIAPLRIYEPPIV